MGAGMTNDLIERGARALYDHLAQGSFVGPYRSTNSGSNTETTLDGDFDLADLFRAALQAMREPTDAMLSTGCVDLGSGGELNDKNLAQIWRSMIDAALS